MAKPPPCTPVKPPKVTTVARYRVVSDYWTDMPEAQPRARARVAQGRPDAEITVTSDGKLHYDQSDGVEVDTYQAPGLAAVRAEKRVTA